LIATWTVGHVEEEAAVETCHCIFPASSETLTGLTDGKRRNYCRHGNDSSIHHHLSNIIGTKEDCKSSVGSAALWNDLSLVVPIIIVKDPSGNAEADFDWSKLNSPLSVCYGRLFSDS
jgi:hypothetical protein